MTSHPERPSKRRYIIGAVAVGVVVLGGALFAQVGGSYMFSHVMHGGFHTHGAGGLGHDETTMPGLLGRNATAQETAELATMFRNFETITREVVNLPNGIRTATRSTDPEVMDQLVSHVFGMIRRVEELDDPQIRIQSPTLDIFFVQGAEIETDIAVTDEGVVVTQTSDNPQLVLALQKHAAEVTDMADRGMQAVHETMMGGNG